MSRRLGAKWTPSVRPTSVVRKAEPAAGWGHIIIDDSGLVFFTTAWLVALRAHLCRMWMADHGTLGRAARNCALSARHASPRISRRRTIQIWISGSESRTVRPRSACAAQRLIASRPSDSRSRSVLTSSQRSPVLLKVLTQHGAESRGRSPRGLCGREHSRARAPA
jgi:hypothetical protein